MNKKETVFALGFFDGVHLGHQALLKACRDLAEETGCAAGVITFDAHPDALVLGSAPGLINTRQDRETLLHHFGMEAIITLPFDRSMMEMPWQHFFDLVTAEYAAAGIVCGSDFRFGYRGEGTASLLKAACGRASIPCVIVPEQTVDGIRVSSTHIRSLLAAGDVEAACRFLGHPHIFTGTVVAGRQLGRTIGIPTANLSLPGTLQIPRQGVYACLAVLDGQKHPAVTNIGTRPTVGGRHVTVEPWILDFDGNLYGRQITLEFHKFLRPEQRFQDLEALRRQIQTDGARTRNELPL